MKAFIETPLNQYPEQIGTYIVKTTDGSFILGAYSGNGWMYTHDHNFKSQHYVWLREVDSEVLVDLLKKERRLIGSPFQRDDVVGHAKNEGHILTDEEINAVCDYLGDTHDASIGINWDVIENAIHEVCPGLPSASKDDEDSE